MTELYVVIRTGNYRHAIGGIFDDKVRACEVARQMARDDKDSYHDYEVIPYELNRTPIYAKAGDPFEFGYDKSPTVIEADALYTVNKEKALIAG